MNLSIKELAEIAEKKSRLIIGLMSGTSLDGLDIALCRIKGSGKKTEVKLEQFKTLSYDRETKERLRKISSVEHVLLSGICYQHTWLAALHARLILKALEEWRIDPRKVDCIASHGQTIYHYPARDQKNHQPRLNSTLQIGDGDHIAVKTGILTISDFRQKHTAMGGEGAPLAGFADEMLFADAFESRILLNIGGIGNFTYLPAKNRTGRKPFTTDTGPGNTLIDKLSQAFFQQAFDEDAHIAKSGIIHKELLNTLLNDPWFDENGSKSTGPEYFSVEWLKKTAAENSIDLTAVSPEDIIRTITELSAQTIANSIAKKAPKGEYPRIFVSGGGIHNPLILKGIKKNLPGFSVRNFSELGLNPDAKEAVIFAVLANEMLAGKGFGLETENGKIQNVNLGKISFPE